ncbi:DegT/DnrJ/EryC1/StrS family aminotransferase [Helicobacter sp. 13S00477-4]|uniref:DegT/DnrJ/EryC1/StrS family aminotransferase n=1 Tax=Helicobacter sp. 13S00477-4 TaxID=1905759 RepID=UPI000BA55A91|nr:DegT/DnrJ/EryC1/StrS family aminotransferase [Helicobacter sp. 13S00477-4]PAF51520.1 aminotransferase DegT [Helicobacter sp. 13S00477-4]
MHINVNKPYLPDIKKYHQYLDSIWKNHHLTNFGPLSTLLEEKLCEYLKIPHILFVTNGTIALQIAYKLIGLKATDEVITTPFSFVATSSTLSWEGLKAKFCDIDKKTFCIDSKKIASKINQKTKAILPVHVFGNACEVEEIEKIAKTHQLKIIYDAAHAFGVNYKEKNILNYGDISTLSFHATKLFHTIEGGGIVCQDWAMISQAKEIINFGLKNSLPYTLGINAKNSEFHAAMGLCILEEMDFILQERQRIWDYYYSNLKDHFSFQKQNQNSNNNHHYFPILFENETILLKTLHALNNQNIFPRRYFYPSLDTLPFLKNNECPISRDIANRILCLPIYIGLDKNTQDKIIKELKSNLS